MEHLKLQTPLELIRHFGASVIELLQTADDNLDVWGEET